ncbi:MAG: ComF family protein [Planctomycetota bacterium]
MWSARLRTVRPPASRFLLALGRLVFPPHCSICRRPAAEDEDRYLCRDCLARIVFVTGPTCPRCGHVLGKHADTDKRCVQCRNLPLRFDRAVSAAHHAGGARQMVLALKFGRQQHQAFPLAKMMTARLEDTDILERVQAIVPVPLHRSRTRSRGFNQAGLLARELGRLARVPVLKSALRRTRNTPPQTRALSLAARRRNVKGAFAVRSARSVEGKTLLVVDDVMTTGATTSECAATLKRAGAKRVFVATATRRMTVPPRADAAPGLRPYEIESLRPPPDVAAGLPADRA